MLIPPAATNCTSGSASRTARTSSTVVMSSGSSPTVVVERCPPASALWTDSQSAPASTARRASATPATVTTTAVPTSCRARTMPGSGMPKVNETTATGSSSSAASVASWSKSVNPGDSARATSSRLATGPIASA